MSSATSNLAQSFFAIVVTGLFILFGNVTVSYMSGSESLLDIAYTVLKIEPTITATIVVGAAMTLLLGVLTDAFRPFLKKYASLLPEQVNMFSKLLPTSKQFIHDEGFFDMSNFDTIIEGNTKRGIAQFNHQLLYLAKRFSEYFGVGELLMLADKETDLYTLLSVGAIAMTVQSSVYMASTFIAPMQAPPMGQWFMFSTTIIFAALALLFTNRAKISMLHSFFHATNMLNDLPYLNKKL